jgi:hypothetical protein
MPNGEDEGQPPEDTGETPTDEGGEQLLSGEVEPASQPDEGTPPADPTAGMPTPEELEALAEALTAEPRMEMGPLDELETSLAEADTTGGPSDIDPTSVA